MDYSKKHEIEINDDREITINGKKFIPIDNVEFGTAKAGCFVYEGLLQTFESESCDCGNCYITVIWEIENEESYAEGNIDVYDPFKQIEEERAAILDNYCHGLNEVEFNTSCVFCD